MKELGISNKNSTYTKYKGEESKLIGTHVKQLKRSFKLNTSEIMSVLPSMHWTPKMHKVPSKSRFIVAASKCTTKELAKEITAILKLFYRQIENYNKKLQFGNHINSFWVVKNKDPIVASLKKLSDLNKAKSIATYDFSTLYTKIPHAKLISVLEEITDFCFNGCNDSKLWINKGTARWCHTPKKEPNLKKRLISKDMVKKEIAYLLGNCYFKVGNIVFKQVIGIPMGTDPAPFMANLFLYHYENKFIKELKETDRVAARKFGHIWRYIDDLGAVNDDKMFENNISKIYPPELELKKENTGYLNASLLELDIRIIKDKFSLKLYDKRDDFGFSIVRMPYASNNMPFSIFYSSFCSELIRIARCSTDKDNFIGSAVPLMVRMFDQGAEISRTRESLSKLFSKHHSLFDKFFDSLDSFLLQLMQF